MLEDRELGARAADLLSGRQHHGVDQLGAGGAHGVQSRLVQAVGVLAVGGVGLAQDADPGAAQALGVAVPRVVLGAFGERAQQERSVVDAAAMGMIPPCEIRRRVGLMPTTPFADEGQVIEPSVSVPTARGAMPAATATAEPLLEPQGVRSRTCGFLVWRPRPLHPLAERLERKLAHSLRLALPRMTAPASL